MHFIIKPTRREREERLAESRTKTSHHSVEGITRTTEEAFEISRQREREGHSFTRPYAVSDKAAESIQADRELTLRHGINPDTMEPLYSKSTAHA